mmetsp:Transcript_165/g.441  ORF Transcript_165/g.441 Transcript_165/m.441 type:complete len:228 (+) Transcript_165:871-1554(+)
MMGGWPDGFSCSRAVDCVASARRRDESTMTGRGCEGSSLPVRCRHHQWKGDVTARRVVSRGSSLNTVPTPTSMASWMPRREWVIWWASGPLRPSGIATPPAPHTPMLPHTLCAYVSKQKGSLTAAAVWPSRGWSAAARSTSRCLVVSCCSIRKASLSCRRSLPLKRRTNLGWDGRTAAAGAAALSEDCWWVWCSWWLQVPSCVWWSWWWWWWWLGSRCPMRRILVSR